MIENTVSVLMAGGMGTRFWPLSTPTVPKQFISVFGDKSLYRQTVDRAGVIADADRLLILTNKSFGDLVAAQSPEIPPERVVLEPLLRDTAAAIGLASFIVEKLWPGSVMVVMPSDHLIRDNEGFRKTIESAVTRALEGGLGTIGIPPAYPATEYGYLHLASRPDPGQAVPLAGFVEKPNLERAGEFLASGDYLWNSGIFVWRAASLLAELEKHLPATHAALAPLAEVFATEDFAPRALEAFEGLERISIDFGVMEKASEVWAVPASFDWSDVGGWKAAREFLETDDQGNRVRGAVLCEKSRDNIIVSGEGHKVLCAGVEGLIVVSTSEGTLVCKEELLDTIKPQLQEIIKRSTT